MAKWFGKVGYATTEEVEPGIWKEQITEREYFGDVMGNRYRHQNSGEVIDSVTLSNVISIVADPFAIQHCSEIVYVEHMENNWKVTDIEPQFHRLLLTIGGVYNGEQTRLTK